jgi:hypothetical protein
MTTPALSISKETNPLRSLAGFGQSVWLDYIRRSLITSGELKRLVLEDGLRGVTSNPAIFEKAIVGSTDYQAVIESKESAILDSKALYEKIAVKDVQDAADILRSVYDESKQRDGYVSLEVSPVACSGHGRNHRGGAATLESGKPAKPDGKSAGHTRGNSRYSPTHQRRHQCECHPAIFARRVRRGRNSLHRGSDRPCSDWR